MNRHLFSLISLLALGLFIATLPARADSRFNAKRLDQLDKLGSFPPAFKKVAHAYVDVIQSIADTSKEEKMLREQAPGLERQTAGVQTKIEALHQELADYDHTDDTDFIVLQNKMNDTSAKPKAQLLQAEVFVWSYPSSLHLPQAQAYLQQVQKLIADQLQAEKDAEAAVAAARALLLQRVHDRALDLNEWKAFLNNMSQEDVTKYLGPPSGQEGDYWIYSGAWALDPATNQKIGLRINFNGGRAINVLRDVTPQSRSGGSSSD